MASVFEWATKNIVRELSRDRELIPVDSLNSSFYFSPYSLVRKKTRSSLFWRARYVCLHLTLKDILDPSSPEPEVTQLGPFHFTDEVDGKVSAGMEVTASVQGKISGQISESNKSTFEVKTLMVPPATWDCLQKERKLKTPEPSVFQQLRERGENLYVVTEAVKTQKETILTMSRNRGGFGKIAIPGLSCIQGEGQGHLNTVKTVTVPEGSILAFQVAKLMIQDQWSVLLLPDKNQNTFLLKGSGIMRMPDDQFSDEGQNSLQFHSEGLSGICFPSDFDTVLGFEQLQAEVKSEQRPLMGLDKKFQQFLLQALLGLLQKKQDLLDLEDMLEQSLYTGEPPQKVKGMTDTILSKLQDQNGQLVEEVAGAFLYLLGALNALNDQQHQLLIQLLEKKEKILSQEVDLVKEILKENFDQTKEKTFSLPSELLSFVQGQDENFILTCGLLEECGLQISGDEPQFTWNPSALHSLCALYGSLLMLQALKGAC